MDIQKIKELALANGFKLKEQASGNLDLNAYVYDFANAIEREAKAQAVPEGYVLVPLDVVERCMSHICLAMCHQNNSNSENDVMQMDLEVLESALEVQEPAND